MVFLSPFFGLYLSWGYRGTHGGPGWLAINTCRSLSACSMFFSEAQQVHRFLFLSWGMLEREMYIAVPNYSKAYQKVLLFESLRKTKKNLGGGNSNMWNFLPRSLGRMNPFWLIFFKWVETTNQKTNTDSHVIKLITKQIEHTFCCVWGIPVHYKCTSIFIFNVFVHSHRIHGTIVYLPTWMVDFLW